MKIEVNIDRGLAATGLIVLACVLAIFLSIAVPISITPDQIKLSDWLGFAGNVLAAAITIAAAVVAWHAVQRQIKSQREEMLIGVMTWEADRLEDNIPTIDSYYTIVHDVKKACDLAAEHRDVFYSRLKTLNLDHTGVHKLEESIKDSLGYPVPSQWSRNLAAHLHAVRGNCDIVRDIEASGTWSDGILTGVDIVEYRATQERLDAAIGHVGVYRDTFMERLQSDRRNLRKLRKRIEAALQSTS